MSWVSVVLGADTFLLYAYTDRSAGPSAKGTKLAGSQPTHDDARRAVERPDATLRLAGMNPTPLSSEWIAYLQLPAEPGWMLHVGDSGGTPWRRDPQLQGAFHPQFADDLEATFVLLAHKTLEKMWVRLDAAAPSIGYRGALLNSSHVEPTLAAGTRVMIRPSRSHPPALWVPEGPAADNLRTHTAVCEACGFDLVFIPIAELQKMQFPDLPPGMELEQMTTRCLMCRSTMHVARRHA